MKTELLKPSREKKIIYLVIGLFVLNAFGMIPVWVIGAYTAEPMKITAIETREDGTTEERINEIYYHEGLTEGLQNYIYEFFRYSLPVTMMGYFLVTPPDFSHDYVRAVVWGLSFISIPLTIKITTKLPRWRRATYAYLIAVQVAGMWALPSVNFECIPFIGYPISAGPPCEI